MAKHNITGNIGEQVAIQYLTSRNFIILHKNWKHSYYEVDIVALKEDVLHIVEVKTRTGSAFGMPEDAVSRKKFSNLLIAGEEFMLQNPEYKRIQYDVLSVSYTSRGVECFFIEDFYY